MNTPNSAGKDAGPSADCDAGAFQRVQGRCPCCGATSLFLGAGGYVTCSRATCTAPDAASTLLDDAPRARITCGAQYGQNPEVCYHEHGHPGPHSNRYGTTWTSVTAPAGGAE